MNLIQRVAMPLRTLATVVEATKADSAQSLIGSALFKWAEARKDFTVVAHMGLLRERRKGVIVRICGGSDNRAASGCSSFSAS